MAENLMVDLSVVVPCYNEEESLGFLYEELSRACRLQSTSYELVLTDDGSKDRTWELIEELSQRDSRVVGIKLTRNFGHAYALSAGLDLCRGQRILIIDADLQDPPELLADMMKLMDQGNDVVYGQRQERLGETFFKRASASLYYRMINALVDRPIPRDTGDFRLMSRKALDMLKRLPETHRFVRGMVNWIGLRQTALGYVRQPRKAGVTKYPFRKMLRFAWDGVTAFSVKPLSLAIWLGGMSAAFGVAVLLYGVWAFFYGHVVPGWTSLMGIIAILSSAQLLVLGVIGEYLGRLYEQSKGRPLYLIDQVTQSQGTQSTSNCLVAAGRFE